MVLHGNHGDLATPSDGRERSSSDMVKFHLQVREGGGGWRRKWGYMEYV